MPLGEDMQCALLQDFVIRLCHFILVSKLGATNFTSDVARMKF